MRVWTVRVGDISSRLRGRGDESSIGKSSQSWNRSGCLLYLRQLARGVCHVRAEDTETDLPNNPALQAELELFDGQLQRRYPIGDGQTYRLREHLTYTERMANADRLDAESVAKAKHARALRAETERLVAQGKLIIEAAA
jgi:hypothetical protein